MNPLNEPKELQTYSCGLAGDVYYCREIVLPSGAHHHAHIERSLRADRDADRSDTLVSHSIYSSPIPFRECKGITSKIHWLITRPHRTMVSTVWLAAPEDPQ